LSEKILNHLNDILNQLGLIENNAVFYRGGNYSPIQPEFRKRLNKIDPDAYYVFNELPFILFFDLSEPSDNTRERESEIHKQVWSFDQSPVIFIIKQSEVQLFNAFGYTKDRNNLNGGLEEIKLSAEERNDRFSFWNLQSGETWKNWNKDYLAKSNKSRVNQQLFDNIKKVREELTNPVIENALSEDQANTLILRLIFIRYLIDREVKIDEAFISGEGKLERRKSFSSLIENPDKIDGFFEKLNGNFNGVLFKDISFHLSDYQAKQLAVVFRGEKPEMGSIFFGSDFYFEIYDFSIIPVEVISGIYESLISPETRKLDSAVYTPSFLVDYILNDTVDVYLESHRGSECKIFDPAVGSGIFLVQSLRRMIDKEKQINPTASDDQFNSRIREIAKNNLFGIDVNLQALKVTCFSIYIALLDYQEPKDIDKYEFPNLIHENLFEANFFETDKDHIFNQVIKKIRFDFILGNPPWKKDNSKKHLDWVNTTKTYDKRIVGKLEIAQSFLLRVKEFMTPETKAALIVTSTVFYNISKTTNEFKKDFLNSFCIDKFFDLSPVRRLIFEKKNSPASIVYFRLSNAQEYSTNIIDHQSVKSNSFLKNYKMLVIEKYDRKQILQKHFIENDWMFKVALYGNTLDFRLLTKLKNTKINLAKFLKQLNAPKGAGIMKGDELHHSSYSEIIEKRVISNSEIQKFYTPSHENYKVLKLEDSYLKSGRINGLYNGNQIFIKEQAIDESEICISTSDSSYVFKKGVFGISFNNWENFSLIYAVMNSNLFTYYIYLVSGSWGTSTRPQIRWNEEFLSFPMIEFREDVKKQLEIIVNDFLSVLNMHSIKSNSIEQTTELASINKLINKFYNVDESEKDLIDYVLKVSRYQFQEGKQIKFTRKVHQDRSFLEKYTDIYLDEFENIYSDEFLQIEVYPLNHFIAMNFIFHKEKPSKYEERIIYPKGSDEKEILQRLANNLTISKITSTSDPKKNLFIQKDIKGFERNSFYIIKPNEFKCWHRAMAWYDVAEFKKIIEEAELNHLKEKVNEF